MQLLVHPSLLAQLIESGTNEVFGHSDRNLSETTNPKRRNILSAKLSNS